MRVLDTPDHRLPARISAFWKSPRPPHFATTARLQERGESAAAAATSLAQFARMRAADPTHLSPFAYGAQQLGYRYFGGKMDDITVLCAYVVAASARQAVAAAAAAAAPPASKL
jgi:hypothetical protein